MSKITATIITLNEEEKIGACLDSLEGVADEIIVVDSYSTDKTAEMCRERGCKVTLRKFDGYGAQKQYAVSLATNSHIISIDADEVLDSELRKNIKKLKEDGFEHRVYCFERLNYYCGQPILHSGWNHDCPTRLFDRRYATWNLRDVHEAVVFPKTLHPELIGGKLLHYRCATAEEYRRKQETFAKINAKILMNEDSTSKAFGPRIMAAAAYIKTYIFELGFLDGKAGKEISRTNAYATKVTYQELRNTTKAEK